MSPKVSASNEAFAVEAQLHTVWLLCFPWQEEIILAEGIRLAEVLDHISVEFVNSVSANSIYELRLDENKPYTWHSCVGNAS